MRIPKRLCVNRTPRYLKDLTHSRGTPFRKKEGRERKDEALHVTIIYSVLVLLIVRSLVVVHDGIESMSD